MNALAILIACGKEEEIAPGTEAAFLTMGSGPLLTYSLKVLQEVPSVDGIIIAVNKERAEATVQVVRRYGFSKVCGVVVGGVSRSATLTAVIAKMPEPAPIIVVHEAARPFIKKDLVEDTIKAAKRYGCSIAAHKLSNAVKLAPKGVKVSKTMERGSAWVAQSPQTFKFDVLQKILSSKSKLIDDESEFVRKPAEVHMVEAGSGNMKIRNHVDLAVATALMASNLP